MHTLDLHLIFSLTLKSITGRESVSDSLDEEHSFEVDGVLSSEIKVSVRYTWNT